jgi:hypothetical protein
LTLPRQLGPSLLENVIGSVLAIPVITIGFAAASRSRPRPRSDATHRLARAGLSLAAGLLLGAAILLLNALLVLMEPRVAHVAGTGAGPWWEAWLRAFEAAPLEEVLFRLTGMSLIAWTVSRYVANGAQAFRIALVTSALLFGMAHLPYVSVAGFGLVLGNTAGGLLFGWLFWRWGLPYAMLSHFAAGLIIQSVGPSVLR